MSLLNNQIQLPSYLMIFHAVLRSAMQATAVVQYRSYHAVCLSVVALVTTYLSHLQSNEIEIE